MTKRQPLRAKLGEVRFRNKLADQHSGGKTVYPQEYSKKEMHKVIIERIEKTRNDFNKLKAKGIKLSPFLEIGAGYGQTSLVLTNEFGLKGFASDIAAKPLKTMYSIAKDLGYSHLPSPVVFDAETIPFPDNSFPFVFCYQTLHHFPHPLRVTKEIERVLLPGGTFFFPEEPVSQTFNIPLWYRPTKLRWWEKILKITLILPFISRIGKTEIDQGILEETFSLDTWKQSLAPFEHIETELEPFPFGPKGSLEKKNLLNRIFLFFLGGGIKGLAKKKQSNKKPAKAQFTCPACPKRTLLKRKKDMLTCKTCNDNYPIKQNIPILIKKNIRNKLYG